jgi:hypothetical protein
MLEQGLFPLVRQSLGGATGVPSTATTLRMYYDYVPRPGWRIVVLDT